MIEVLQEARLRGLTDKKKRLVKVPTPDLEQKDSDLSVPVIAHFGGGANSTAYLIEWVKRGLRLDLVLFSDTGGERPDTYEHVAAFSDWLEKNKAPPVSVVQYQTKDGILVSLEERCLETKRLPSLAYGFKKCSQRFKRDPQVRFINNWEPARATWLQGKRCIALVGYDADEPHRMERQREREEEYRRWLKDKSTPIQSRNYTDARKFLFRYPLLEWDWGREECVEVCQQELGYIPGKSSCFFCPASKPKEIRELALLHPALAKRALAIESNAESTTGHTPKLGRWRHWGDFLRGEEAAGSAPDIACECVD